MSQVETDIHKADIFRGTKLIHLCVSLESNLGGVRKYKLYDKAGHSVLFSTKERTLVPGDCYVFYFAHGAISDVVYNTSKKRWLGKLKTYELCPF